MTILRENLDNMNAEQRRLCAIAYKMQRQQSFDLSNDLRNELNERRTCSLSSKSFMKRKRDRTSLIFDWLTDPCNQFMFQDGSTEGHVFRSNSTVETRPSNFCRNTLYHSVRGWDDKHNNDFVNNNNNYIFSKEKPKELSDDNLIPARKGKDFCTKIGSDEHIKYKENSNLNHKTDCDDGVFTSVDQECSNLSTKFNKISLQRDCMMNTFCDGASVDTSFSFPNYSRSKHQGKLRRINSDALFYKDVFRDNDRRHSFTAKSKNCLSKKLESIVKNDKDSSSADLKSQSVEDTIDGAEDENMKKIVKEIKEIIFRSDLSLVKELGQCGFDFNAKDSSGNCALHYAALLGNEEMIQEILDNGGSVWIRNDQNQLPVELASNMNVRMLLSRVTLFYREQYSGQIESCLVCKGMSFEL